MRIVCCEETTKPTGQALRIGPVKEPLEEAQVLACGLCGRVYEPWATTLYVRAAPSLAKG